MVAKQRLINDQLSPALLESSSQNHLGASTQLFVRGPGREDPREQRCLRFLSFPHHRRRRLFPSVSSFCSSSSSTTLRVKWPVTSADSLNRYKVTTPIEQLEISRN